MISVKWNIFWIFESMYAVLLAWCAALCNALSDEKMALGSGDMTPRVLSSLSPSLYSPGSCSPGVHCSCVSPAGWGRRSSGRSCRWCRRGPGRGQILCWARLSEADPGEAGRRTWGRGSPGGRAHLKQEPGVRRRYSNVVFCTRLGKVIWIFYPLVYPHI